MNNVDSPEEIRKVIYNLRRDYSNEEFDESQIQEQPFDLLQEWLGKALKAGVFDPNAMTLSTVGKEGYPSNRVVLLRGIEEGKLVFFTNYESQKGHEIEFNPKVCISFFWPEIFRQIRIDGHVSKVTSSVSDAYFKSRPRESQIGAWASNQSFPVTDRKTLDEGFDFYKHKYDKKEVPRPDSWGGYEIIPVYFEFWQGRMNRLHDRIVYKLEANDNWKVQRLYP